jgi:hypothetical protein
MRIGSSLALLAVGLILALAVRDSIAGIDLALVGWILAGVGLVGLIITVSLTQRTRVVRRREYPAEYTEERYPPDQRF